jgi:hypothetical protein
MVRLRSNRWYSADGQGRSRSTVGTKVSSSRRVLSLCLLLALVVVLMQKAADPRHVRNAFQALGVPLDESAVGAAALHPSVEAGPPVEPSEEEMRWRATCRDLVPRLLGQASDAEIAQLSARWFAVDRSHGHKTAAEENSADDNRAGPALQRLRERTLQQLGELRQSLIAQAEEPSTAEATADAMQDNIWASQLARFSREWRALWQELEPPVEQLNDVNDVNDVSDLSDLSDSSEPVDRLSAELTAAWVEYLDQRLLASLRDATPWTKSESTAFWRQLQRGEEMRTGQGTVATESEPPLLSTLQLEAEFAVYRGRSVRFRGTVRRADRIERGDPNFGINHYWSLWLRGDDEAPQPVTVYTTQAVAQQLERAVESEQFPRIEVLGIVGKRLAYAAPAGVEVAPTLFAASIIQFADPPPPVSGQTTAELASEFGWAVLIGALLAACALLPIMANWRRSAARAGGKVSSKVSSKVILLAILLSPSMQLHAQRAPVEQAPSTTPPWARPNDEAAGKILSQQLQTTLTAPAADELRGYQQTGHTDFPTSALKILNTLRQVGWEDALPSGYEALLPEARMIARADTLRGWVRLATPVQLSPQQQAWFQSDDNQALFRLEVETTQTSAASAAPSRLTTVYCVSVPSAWLTSSRLLQPVTVEGLSLLEAPSPAGDATENTIDTSVAGNETAATEQRWCMFAPGPQWRLDREDAIEEWLPPWTDRQRQLGQLGWDLAHLDSVRRHSQQPLRATEAAPFYSLLRGVSEAMGNEAEEQGLLQILAEPREMTGARVNWPVRLVSGSLVTVPDPRHQDWLGAERYFQFDGLVDIGRQTVQYKIPGTADESGVKFEGEFPVTIVMRDRSPFVPAEKIAAGQLSWEVGEYVQVSGLFYRLWSYESELMSEQASGGARQAAPLIVANRLTRSSPTVRPTTNSTGWFGYALTLTMVGILAVVIWSQLHKPKKRLRFR